jgi:hypothetical protein
MGEGRKLIERRALVWMVPVSHLQKGPLGTYPKGTQVRVGQTRVSILGIGAERDEVRGGIPRLGGDGVEVRAQDREVE